MTKKEISVKLKQFIKAHKPDEFKTLDNAVDSFWDEQNEFVNGKTIVRGNTFVNSNKEVARWWWGGKSPLSESDILSSMDTKYVTHKHINIHACRYECSKAIGWNNRFDKSEAIGVLFDLSFMYNIIGVEQKPGDLRIWVRESEDHQTNISGEVVEKIAKCLEF